MTLTKICGLTTPDTLDAALEGGAAFVGAVVFPKSPRHIPPLHAATLFDRARGQGPGRAKVVAVLVDPDDALLSEVALILRPDLIQLHGHETPQRAAEARRLTGAGIIKALSIRDEADFANVADWTGVADHLLFDAKPPKGADLPGGLGASFDWTLMQNRALPANWFLAGGLDPQNITEAVRISGAPMVDVSSGVESAPGVKDRALIKAFLDAASRS